MHLGPADGRSAAWVLLAFRVKGKLCLLGNTTWRWTAKKFESRCPLPWWPVGGLGPCARFEPRSLTHRITLHDPWWKGSHSLTDLKAIQVRQTIQLVDGHSRVEVSRAGRLA